MRKLLFILCFLTSLCSVAQVGLPRTDVAVGISCGASGNKVSFANTPLKQNYKISPQYGFTARYICEKYYNSICGVQVELNYQNLGWSDFFEPDVDKQFVRNQHFLELPLLMQMGWGRERKGLKFLFEAGPTLHYYLGYNDKIVNEPWNDPYYPNKPNYQYTNDIDNKLSYGISAGIGVEHSSVIGHFMLEARYMYGLGDMYDNSKKGFFARSSNQTIEVKLTYLFDILKTKLEK